MVAERHQQVTGHAAGPASVEGPAAEPRLPKAASRGFDTAAKLDAALDDSLHDLCAGLATDATVNAVCRVAENKVRLKLAELALARPLMFAAGGMPLSDVEYHRLRLAELEARR